MNTGITCSVSMTARFSFNWYNREIQGFSEAFHGCFKVSGEYQWFSRSFKESQGCSRGFRGFQTHSRNIPGSFSRFQECCRRSQARRLQAYFKGVIGSFRSNSGVFKSFQGCCVVVIGASGGLRGGTGMFQGIPGISWDVHPWHHIPDITWNHETPSNSWKYLKRLDTDWNSSEWSLIRPVEPPGTRTKPFGNPVYLENENLTKLQQIN